MSLAFGSAGLLLAALFALLCGALLDRRSRLRPQAADPLQHIALDVINAMQDGVAIIDSMGMIVETNPAFRQMTGFSREELVGTRPPYPYWPEDEAEKIVESMMQAVRGEIVEYAATYQRKDGSRFYAMVNPSSFSSGNATYYMSMFRDVTERRQDEESLKASELRYRALYDSTPVLYLTQDAAGVIVSVNRFGAEYLGYAVDELVGQPGAIIIPISEIPAADQHLNACIDAPDSSHRWETIKQRKDGSVVHVKEMIRVTADADGLLQAQYLCEDITETRHLVDQLAYEATHDPLTRLLNRWEFERRLRKSLQSAAKGFPHALCYLDLDQFELINDSCGHEGGDQLLRQLAEMILERFGKLGAVARLGGDEFGILLENCNAEQAEAKARELRNLVHDYRFNYAENRFRLTASVGLVLIDEQYSTPEQVLQNADAACYSAKELGRDRVAVYNTEDTQQASRRGAMGWAIRVRRALEDRRLRLVAQPIVPVNRPSEGRHYEVLLRMIDEKGEMLPTANFISAAERYGLATQLDMWTINTILDWLNERPGRLQKLHMCTINLSGHSLGNPEFHQFLLQKCMQGRVPLEKLCFEITETAAISNLAQGTQLMRMMRRVGCKFALDDFGSGLSSFAYLRDLPVDYLKIDGVFVRGIDKDPLSLAVLKSVNDLGHMLGKQTIAEFVENDAILEKLREIGVDYAQGYGIGRPQPLESSF